MYLYIFICLAVISSCDAFGSILNLDEINAVHYNINILSIPVLKDQLSEAETIKLTSVHGQEYICDIPIVKINAEDLKKIEDVSDDPIDMAELLAAMEAAPCLVKRIHWWTYEFCYGSIIKQYHVEDNKVLGPILILGRYESEYNWKNVTQSKNKLQRFHTQLYVNGTRCDINGKHRQTEVRFHCDDGASDYIRQVDEPQSCRYLVVIGTSRVCHHPYLEPQITKIPYKINCSPTVTDEQLQTYHEVQAVKTARAQELKARAEKLKAEMELKAKEEELKAREEAELKIIADAEAAEPKTNVEEAEELDTNPTEKETQIDEKKVSPVQGTAVAEAAKETPLSSLAKNKRLLFAKESLKSKMETEDNPITNLKNILAGMSEAMDNAAPAPTTRHDYMKPNFRKVLETIKEEMETYRNELLQEYSNEEETEDSNDESAIFKRKMQAVKKRVADLAHAKTGEDVEIYEDIKRLLDEGLDNILTILKESYPPLGAYHEEMVQRVTDLRLMISEMMLVDKDSREDKLRRILKVMSEMLTISEIYREKAKEHIESLGKLFSSNDVKNRVQGENTLHSLLLNEAEARGESVPTSEDGEKQAKLEKRKIQILKEEKMVESRKNKLEQRIKERLKKSGLDAQKIEVQIISTYMTDDEYPSLVALSPKDEEILIRIVNSNEEEIFETKRYSSMVESYNFNVEKALLLEEPPNEEVASDAQSVGTSDPQNDSILKTDDSDSDSNTDDSVSQSKADVSDDRLPTRDQSPPSVDRQQV